MKPSRDDCIRAVAALVMALQEGDTDADDILAALEAASRCEAMLRRTVVHQPQLSGHS